jgi:hypothetical protein
MNRLLMMVKGLSVVALITLTMVGCSGAAEDSDDSESSESDISSDPAHNGYQKDAWGRVIEKANGGETCPSCGPVPQPWMDKAGPVPDPWQTHSAGTGGSKNDENNGKP